MADQTGGLFLRVGQHHQANHAVHILDVGLKPVNVHQVLKALFALRTAVTPVIHRRHLIARAVQVIDDFGELGAVLGEAVGQHDRALELVQRVKLIVEAVFLAAGADVRAQVGQHLFIHDFLIVFGCDDLKLFHASSSLCVSLFAFLIIAQFFGNEKRPESELFRTNKAS